MYTEFTGSGLYIRLGLEDKKKGLEKRILKGKLKQWKNAKVNFHIQDEVNQKGFLEEKGFHIEVIPPNTSPEHRTQYDIYLKKSKFEDLTNPKDPIIKGGYFVSRSKYDRVDIVYFGV